MDYKPKMSLLNSLHHVIKWQILLLILLLTQPLTVGGAFFDSSTRVGRTGLHLQANKPPEISVALSEKKSSQL
jgi:hypothetical protein